MGARADKAARRAFWEISGPRGLGQRHGVNRAYEAMRHCFQAEPAQSNIDMLSIIHLRNHASNPASYPTSEQAQGRITRLHLRGGPHGRSGLADRR